MLAPVWEQVGLDVGVREAIAVGGRQPPDPVDMDRELPVLVLHPHQHLPRDLVVTLGTAVDAQHAAKVGQTFVWLRTGQ